MSLTAHQLATFATDEYGSYEWREVSRIEFSDTSIYCSHYADCGLCDCGNDVVVMIEQERPRYSRSSKAYVLETETVFECASHLAGIEIPCGCN